MATAAATTIAQVESIYEAGTLDPEDVVTPGIYINRIVSCTAPTPLTPEGVAG